MFYSTVLGRVLCNGMDVDVQGNAPICMSLLLSASPVLYYDDNYIKIDAYTVSALGQCKHKTL